MSSVTVPYWTPSEVLRSLAEPITGFLVDDTAAELRWLCISGRVRSQWKATCTPEGGIQPSSNFEAIAPEKWHFISFSGNDPLNFSDKVHSVGMGRGANVEVQFLREDVEREMGERVAARPARLKRFWPKAREIALAWLEKEGFPEPGDGGQAKLERYVSDWLACHGYEAVESTVRNHVRGWIEEFKRSVSA